VQKKWGDSNANVISLKTNEMIKPSDYELFFKLVYSNSFDDFEDEIRSSLIQMDVLARYYCYQKLCTYTSELILSSLCYDNFVGIATYLFQLPLEVPKETQKIRDYTVHYVKAFIGLLKMKHDTLRNLLGVMPFDIFSNVLLSKDSMMPFIFRRHLYNEYLSIHFGVNDHTLIRTCQTIGAKERSMLDFLYKKMQTTFYLDVSQYAIDVDKEVVIRKHHKLSTKVHKDGKYVIDQIVSESEDGFDIIIEKNFFVCHGFKEAETVMDLPLYVFDSEMDYVRSTIRIKSTLRKGNFNIEYCMESSENKIETIGTLELTMFSTEQSKTTAIKNFAMNSELPRERLGNETFFTTSNAFTDDAFEGSPRDSWILPIKMVYFLRSIRVHHHLQ
jgi:hypothetical protein